MRKILRKVSKACLVKKFFNLNGKYFYLGFNKIWLQYTSTHLLAYYCNSKTQTSFFYNIVLLGRTQRTKRRRKEKTERRESKVGKTGSDRRTSEKER